jgi:hypothetical protein
MAPLPRPPHTRVRQPRGECRLVLSVLVVEPDPDLATTLVETLWHAGIADSDIASSLSDAGRMLAERDYAAVVACASTLGDLTPWLADREPDAEAETIRALVLVLDEPLPPDCELPHGVAAISRAALGRSLVASLRQALRGAGHACLSRAFCGRPHCPHGH